MPDERAEKLAEIVKSALDEPSETREIFLDRACGPDAEMRREAESLLDHDAGLEDFLKEPALHVVAETFAGEEGELDGETIGQYEILSLIARGGMGEVYLAQDTELGRQVAIKFVRRGFGTADFVRHLRHEARILASLNDPHIARLYGGAVAPQGVPYFVMEYVEGERLDRFCADRGLTTNEKLELFRKVCSAVAYAHQHLVIHRDLKPANIRVTADGEPKLLDFGIAKLLDPGTTGSGEATMTLASVMTPDYASPEQVNGEAMTTASDIYSLGVILYELLTGEKPYRLTSKRPAEIARVITEREAARPSSLRPELAGDLDNILLMALRKEPERRYSSVGQFSEDLRRHLAGLPVLAHKDTAAYRTKKFVRRHRGAVAAMALVILALVGGLVATAWQGRVAQGERQKAQRVSAFLEEIVRYSSPYLTQSGSAGGGVSMSEALDAASRRLETKEFDDQPEVKAELERVIGESYREEGDGRAGDQHLKSYVVLATKAAAGDETKLLPVLSTKAELLFGAGRMQESEAVYRELLPALRKAYSKGNVSAGLLVGSLNEYGYLRRTQGDSKDAELAFREALTLASRLPQAAHFIVGITRSTLASTLADEGSFPEALQTAQEAVEDGRRAGLAGTPSVGFSLTVLGGFLTDDNRLAEADKVLAKGEAIFRRFLEPSHLWLGDNFRNQGIAFYKEKRYREAEEKVDECLRIYRAGFNSHYDQYPTALIIRGLILSRTERMNEGERVLRDALKMRTDSLPPQHYWVAQAKGALGDCLARERRLSEARPLLESSYRTLKLDFGPNDPRTKEAAARLQELTPG
ncbi:MAG: serine/threonine-protein kinase [Chthoniobacterales bacterium]